MLRERNHSSATIALTGLVGGINATLKQQHGRGPVGGDVYASTAEIKQSAAFEDLRNIVMLHDFCAHNPSSPSHDFLFITQLKKSRRACERDQTEHGLYRGRLS